MLREDQAAVTYRDDEAVVRELYPSLFRYAAVVGARSHEPDDLVQDALVAALRVQDLVELEHPQAYLRRAILTAAMKKQRRRGLFGRAAPRLVGGSRTEPDYPSDLDDLEHLEPRDRAPLYLVHVEGLSYAEVAEQLHETETNCRQRASRARRRLRHELRAEESNYE